jgi:plasmid stabilization system protein ParE
MDRKLIWTEKASGDIEAIVRYIARRDPNAAARIGLGIYERAQILLQHPAAGTILDELREGAGTSSSSADGKLFTRFAAMPSSSAESGPRPWARQTWRLPYERASPQLSALNH